MNLRLFIMFNLLLNEMSLLDEVISFPLTKDAEHRQKPTFFFKDYNSWDEAVQKSNWILFCQSAQMSP